MTILLQKQALDPEQLEAINNNQSTVVIAGPGSGKTRCIVAKAIELQKEGKQFIALTFTRNAAAEMKRRGLNASTIHSYCYTTMAEQENYIFTTYDKLLSDFVESPRKRYEWVLVDEVQDLTPAELTVVRVLQADNIFAVGDPKQSIYGFGGSIGIHMDQYIQGDKKHLHNNYRSIPEVIKRLERIYPRGLKSTKTNHKRIRVALLTRTNDEADIICSILEGKNVDYTRKRKGKRFSGEVSDSGKSKDLFVMTMHCCKGLEFSHVGILNWHKGNGVNYRGSHVVSVDNERNLYYVAASRAEEEFKNVLTPIDAVFYALGVLRK